MTDKQILERVLRMYTSWTNILPARLRPYRHVVNYGICKAIHSAMKLSRFSTSDQYSRIIFTLRVLSWSHRTRHGSYWWPRGERKPRIAFLKKVLGTGSKYFDQAGNFITPKSLI